MGSPCLGRVPAILHLGSSAHRGDSGWLSPPLSAGDGRLVTYRPPGSDGVLTP